MENVLEGKRIAVLATDGFEQSELIQPVRALKKAGAEVEVVSLKKGKIKGWNKKDWGASVSVDVAMESADPTDYDGLMLPGGVMNPDRLRIDQHAIAFIKSFVDLHKPIAAICHGSWPLINAGAVRNRKMTSWPSLKTDLENAGAHWVDEEVVVDGGLVTSRKPDDIPAFTEKMIQEFSRGADPEFDARSTSEGMPESPKEIREKNLRSVETKLRIVK